MIEESLHDSVVLPTVSVVVPCYNYGRFLEGCAASALAQQSVEVRLLIIDDCSSDGTAEIGQHLAEGDDRIEFRRHRENAGLIATANEGLEWARGDLVLLLSADDLLVPGALARTAAIMAEHPHVGMVYGRALYAHEGRPMPEPAGHWRGARMRSGLEWIHLRCRSGHNCVSSPAAVVRGSVQRAVGGYDPACYHASDLNMWLRIAAIADIAYVRGVPQAIYRVHPGSMMHSHGGRLVDLRERKIGFDSFFAATSTALKDRMQLQATVARTLAREALWRASRAVDLGAPSTEVEAFVDFALDTCPQARHLSEWRGLQLRRRIDCGRWALLFPPLLATAAAHRARFHAGRMRLRLMGG